MGNFVSPGTFNGDFGDEEFIGEGQGGFVDFAAADDEDEFFVSLAAVIERGLESCETGALRAARSDSGFA